MTTLAKNDTGLVAVRARRGGAALGSGLDFGLEDPGSIPRLPSPRVGPLMARR